MFRIIEDPSSGSLVQRLAKNYSNGSIVSVDMDRVGVMAAYCDPLCVCSSLCIYIYTVYIHKHSELYTGYPRRNVPDFGRVFRMLKYTDITQNTYIQS